MVHTVTTTQEYNELIQTRDNRPLIVNFSATWLTFLSFFYILSAH